MTRKTLVAGAIVTTVVGLVVLLKPSSAPEVKSSKPESPGELVTLKAVPTPNDERSASDQSLVPAGGYEPERNTEPSAWCAAPRRNEPLLRYAIRFGTALEDSSERSRLGIRPVPRSSIVIMTDEAICRQAAMVYSSDGLGPVLVIRMDSRYLVGNLGFRDDPKAFWKIEIYDERWQLLSTYSQGA